MHSISRRLTSSMERWTPRLGAVLFALVIAAHHIPTLVEAAPPAPVAPASFHAEGGQADHSAPGPDAAPHCAGATFLDSAQPGGRESLPWATLSLVALDKNGQAELHSATLSLRAETYTPPTPELLQLFRE